MINSNKMITTKLSLSQKEIHLWTTEPQSIVDGSTEIIDGEMSHCALLKQYQGLLTPDESMKQQRYKFAKDRHDALITRAFIRDLLSYYADVQPSDWRFEKGEKDKPEIANLVLPLRFNISHTQNLIICAVTLAEDIGCDVENTSRTNDVLSIADRYFSADETQALFALPSTQQRDRFFDYWTLKESYIKAWGLGLSIPLKDFSFTISPNKTAQTNGNISLAFAQHRVDDPTIWRSWLFYPNAQHRVAVSVRATHNNQAENYTFRYFKSIPLVSCEEQAALA